MAENTTKSASGVSINLDTTPVLYTDNIHISVNELGVVFDVTQTVGADARIVARIGMSREHAKRFVGEFGKLLAVTEKGLKKS